MSTVKFNAANLQLAMSDTMDIVYLLSLDSVSKEITVALPNGTGVPVATLESTFPGITAIIQGAESNADLMNKLLPLKYGILWYITEGSL